MRTSTWRRVVSLAVVLAVLAQFSTPLLFLQPQTVAAAQLPAADAVSADAPSAAATASAPPDLVAPLSIARAQSTYQSGGTAVITYTVRNNQTALNQPQIEAGLNVTETADALAGFDPLADPNTVRNLIVTSDLSGSNLLDSSVFATSDASGNEHLFHLGDLAPLADAVFTLTVQLPASAPDFTTLDSGATAYGTLQGRAVSATAHPIRLAPDGFGDWLISTPDATRDDLAMLLATAAIGDDPYALFDLVQGFDFEAYEGSLRGTRGTLWSEAGNSVDQASLLIAMLRGAGYPARYRHGSLPLAEAQALITSMFPPPAAVRGQVAPGAEISDPANDPELLALTQDHWWVEAYLPGAGWTTLDPTAGDAPGSTPATPLGGDETAELTGEIRHIQHFALDVEQYNSFPLGGLNLSEQTVLTATIPAAATTGVPVTLAFAVDSNVLGGLVYTSVEHTYSPYLAYGTGDTPVVIYGTPINDLLTSFPLATNFTTGVWLEVTSTAPDGRTDTYRRTIKDLIGADVRLGGGDSQLPPRDNSPLLQTSDLIQVQPVPNSAYPAAEVDRLLHEQVRLIPEVLETRDALAALDLDDDPTIVEFGDAYLPRLYAGQSTQLELMRALFQYASTGPERSIRSETALVHSYPERPKIILTSQVLDDAGAHASFELLTIAEKAIAYPGQDIAAVFNANFLRTTGEKTLEFDLLRTFLPGDTRSAVGTLLAADEQAIPTRLIFAQNLSELDSLSIPEETKAHIIAYAETGALVWTPEQMVPMDYGEDIGFVAVDLDGDAHYINADGLAASGQEYGLVSTKVAIEVLIQRSGAGFIGGAIAYYLSFFAQAFPVIFGFGPPTSIGAVPGAVAGNVSGKGLLLGLIGAAKTALAIPLGSCKLSPNTGACQAGAVAAYGTVVGALVAGLVGGALDPSLPGQWVGDLPEPATATAITRTQTVAATLPVGTVAFTVQADHHWARSDALASTWAGTGDQTAAFSTLSSPNATLSQRGTPLGSGALQAEDGVALLSGAGRTWSLDGSLATASYGSASTSLALTTVGDYTVGAPGTASQDAQLRSPGVTLNSNSLYAGDFATVFSGDLTLSGATVAPSPGFAASYYYSLTQGRLMVSGIQGGSVTAGGTPVSNPDAVALAGYTGALDLEKAGARDRVTVSGVADFFALSASVDSATLAAGASTRVLPTIQANFAESYLITALTPDGWQVGTDLAGQVVITPTAQADVGVASVLVTAQSQTYPELFASATLDVTVTPSAGVTVDVMPDPTLTIPMGTVQGSDYGGPLTLNHLGDGRVEVPGAAFNVVVDNLSTDSATYDVAATGLPAGWAAWSLSTPVVALEPGASRTVGLYVVPPEGTLPAPGTAYPFTVTVTDVGNGAINASANGTFTMPSIAFPYLTVDPVAQTVTPGQPVTIGLTVQNVGNAAGSFEITGTVRAEQFSTAQLVPSPLTSPADFSTPSLAAGATFGTDLTLDTSSATPGQTLFVIAESAAGEYAPTAFAVVNVASLLTAPLLDSAVCLGDTTTTSRLAVTTLANIIVAVENNCAGAVCPANSRSDLLVAIDGYLAAMGQTGYGGDTSAMLAARATVAAAETGPELLAALPAVVDAAVALNGETCTYLQHRVTARFTPYVDAILLGETAGYSLDVTNAGTLTTTYAITVTGVPGGDLVFNEQIAPDATVNLPVAPTPAALGVYDLDAAVDAVIPGAPIAVGTTAVARMNVVDRFLQITQVLPDPDFVETGVSSSTVSIEVANFAGIALDAEADITVYAPGGATQASASVPLTVLAGNPRTYELTSLTTSGWAEGIYTVTVNLRDGGVLIPDGTGYGFLSVGQALQVTQAVVPEVVAPGNVTVTTIITTEIAQAAQGAAAAGAGFLTAAPGDAPAEPTIGSAGGLQAAPIPLGPERRAEPTVETFEPDLLDASATSATWISGLDAIDAVLAPDKADSQDAPASAGNAAPNAVIIAGGLERFEETDVEVVFAGTWSSESNGAYSGGAGLRSRTLGDTAVFTFTGTWLEVGFGETTRSGQVSVTLDGVDQGVYDLYGRNQTRPLIFGGLSAGQHVLTLTVAAQANPLSLDDWVALDYLTVWDGTALPTGVFEHDDPRVLASNGWTTVNSTDASGGTYGERADKAWFYFQGDSVTLRTVTSANRDEMRVLVDGQFVAKLHLNHTETPTTTLSLDGFGPGLHVVELDEYRGLSSLDTFVTPGVAPFYARPIQSYTRYEEDDPALRYNGLPFNSTASSWTHDGATIAGNRYVARSTALSDTVSLTFTGTAALLGLYTDDWGGLAQVSIDGVEQETVDTYSNEPDLLTRRYAGLGGGSHTITVTVLDDSNPLALRNRVRLDFVDVWDGTPLPAGTYEAEDRSRVLTSDNWRTQVEVAASNGSYQDAGSTFWFPFTGDSVGLTLAKYRFSNELRVFVDDQFVDFLDNYSYDFVTETVSLDGWGTGIHLLRLEGYRGRATIDTFSSPGTAPFWEPVDTSGYFRYEEDDPALRYNGVPYWQAPTSWSRIDNIFSDTSSGAQHVQTSAVSDTVSLTFDGIWVSLGFKGEHRAGEFEVWLDGVSQGVYDLYRHDGDPVTIPFGGLAPGQHTITATNLGTSHPNSSGTRMIVDYIDVWDGTGLPQGRVEAEDAARVYYSGDVGVTSEPAASGGAYVRDGIYRQGNIWYPFTGDSLTLQVWAGELDAMRVKIDGVEWPQVDLFSTPPQTRTLNFTGLGAGVHVLELNRYRKSFNADAFITPAITATLDYPPPALTGIVRYEEDDAALRYNGYVYTQTVSSWNYQANAIGSVASGDHVAQSSTVGDAVTLDFTGPWFGVGFESTSGSGVAEIYLDGVLLDTVDTSGDLGPISVHYDILTGTHTISVTAVGLIRVDYIDTWDGMEMADGWHEADRNDRRGRFHYTDYWATYDNDYASGEVMLGRGLVNSRRAAWFAFTGDALTFRSYQDNNGQYEIFIDGASQGVYTTTAAFYAPGEQYTDQPINWHFGDLGDGPHVFMLKALDGSSRTYLDAFHVDPPAFVTAAPNVEWFDFTSSDPITPTLQGLVTTLAAGDINRDGVVEIVAPARDGKLYVYRGDGQDAGGGSPILWSAEVGAGNEPAIADIDLDGYGEVLLLSGDGLFAFEHDGTPKWITSTIFSSGGDSGGEYGWGGVAVGNLDLDDEPELAVSPRQQQAALVSADGSQVTRFGPTLGNFPTMPILVDASRDGIPDIVLADDDTLYVYDAFNGLALLWSYTYDTSDISPNTAAQAWGAPAVANLDEDDDPEIVMFFEEKLVALNHDGTELWVYKVERANGYRPSAVTIADVDGDSKVEIIVAQALSAGLTVLNHEILAVNDDGTLLWSEIVAETTTSSSGVSTHDFNGDGIWEVLWNGFGDGFLILNGPDGDRIYNEENINSGTIVDYPTVADVDNDGFAEVLLGDGQGLWVVGHDQVWTDSRPLWNAAGYRITNINDDLSVPVQEQPSWLVHNTYRTQTSERAPNPAFQIAFTYTAGIDNVQVLTDTASTPLTADQPTYTWAYRQEATQPVITTTFDSALSGMQPGETRQVSAGTDVTYRLPSGSNVLRLPPLYVTAPRLGSLEPAEQSVALGGTAIFTLTLTHAGTGSAVYTIAAGGVPTDWLTYQASVPVDPGETVAVPITITIPPDADPGTLALWLDVDDGAGGEDQFAAELSLFEGVTLTLDPASQAGTTGQTLAYTLTVVNLETEARTYDLAGTGTPALTLPPSVGVPGNSSATVPVSAVPDFGPQPFTITAVVAGGASASVDGLAIGVGRFGVAAALAPTSATAGPGASAYYTLTLTNLGDVVDTYDLTLDVPGGWGVSLSQGGMPVAQATVQPAPFGTATVLVAVTPPAGAVPAVVPISATAMSQGLPSVAAIAVATVDLTGRGVTVALSPDGQVVDLTAPATWEALITNTGSQADIFDLTLSGTPALAGSLSTGSVSLSPGASQVVQVTVPDLTFLMAGEHSLAVTARSQSDAGIAGQDAAVFTLATYQAVEVAWLPPVQTVTDTLLTNLALIITNTANSLTTYDLAFDGVGLDVLGPEGSLLLPARSATVVLVQVAAANYGTYPLTATATGASAGGNAQASLTFVSTSPVENRDPIVDAGPDQTVLVGSQVQFDGSATDPDSDALASISWDFGDGGSAAGTLTPAHTYPPLVATYSVTLTVTDARGGVGTDVMLVRVRNLIYLPLVQRSP